MKFSVIIPSKNADNLLACVSALKIHEPGCEIIVVDDGLELGRLGPIWNSIKLVKGVSPFVFARNINIGIKAATPDTDGYILLNDDAILQDFRRDIPFFRGMGGFGALAAVSGDRCNFGLISAAITGAVATREQKPVSYPVMKEQFPQWDLFSIREVHHHMLAFVCVYIPRSIYEEIGPLDERFTEYGFDDDDYCKRVTDEGYRLGVFDGCVVEHGSLRSTFRSRPGTSLEPNRTKFIEKWGHAPGATPVLSLTK